MKSHLSLILTAALCLALTPAYAQFGRGRGPSGPSFDGATAKLFGNNSSFAADMEMQTKGSDEGSNVSMSGKMAFDQGKSRFEMDMSTMKNSKMPASAAAQMKAMGMDKMVMIGLADKTSYLIYPGMAAYVQNPAPEAKAATSPDDYKVEITELGKETVDGHPCVKNKAVVTGKDGEKHESTLWNATDLKNFPVKMEMTEHGTQVTMLYKNVSLSKPDASQFAPPADFKKYDSMQTMMMETMMKKRGGFPSQ